MPDHRRPGELSWTFSPRKKIKKSRNQRIRKITQIRNFTEEKREWEKKRRRRTRREREKTVGFFFLLIPFLRLFSPPAGTSKVNTDSFPTVSDHVQRTLKFQGITWIHVIRRLLSPFPSFLIRGIVREGSLCAELCLGLPLNGQE